jgi:DNA (cytosine-5)-methyltransferase 1
VYTSIISPLEGFPIYNDEQFVEDYTGFVIKKRTTLTQVKALYWKDFSVEERKYIETLAKNKNSGAYQVKGSWLASRTMDATSVSNYLSNSSKDYDVTDATEADIYINDTTFNVGPNTLKVWTSNPNFSFENLDGFFEGELDHFRYAWDTNPTHTFTLKDLNTINVSDIPSHNLLCGGFPCQPFSIAGEKKGFDDKRSNVFWKIVEILEKHNPEIIILENVKNLKSHDKGNTYTIIENKLQEIGYHIKTAILDTNKITNIPQHRERIYIIGFRDKEKYNKFNFEFSEQEQGKMCDMLEESVDDKYYYSDRFKVFDEIEKGITKNISENVIYQYRRFYVRENKSNCCPTLTANMGGGGHNVPLLKDDKGIRKLTPRECFNLQGFPKDYKLPDVCDSALYKLAGNAVSVPVVNLIVNKLKEII